MTRENECLKSLGKKTEYRRDYAPEVLETFSNKHPENDYWVMFNCPEFTSLCADSSESNLPTVNFRLTLSEDG